VIIANALYSGVFTFTRGDHTTIIIDLPFSIIFNQPTVGRSQQIFAFPPSTLAQYN